MRTNKPVKFNYLKLLLLLTPPIFTFLFSICLMPMVDTLNVTVWHIALMIFGFVALPLTTYIFKDFGSGGYFLSKTVGILSISLLTWTFTYLGIWRFNKLFLIAVMLAFAVLLYGLGITRKSFLSKVTEQGVITKMLIEEFVFAFVFVLLCFFKGMYPDINGQEKFMDYGFIMSMLRSDKLPANDMWLSGCKINYYYFGQFIYALIIKLFGFAPQYGYTLSMCTAIALPFTSAFTVGTMLIEFAKKHGFNGHPCAKYICGALTGLTTIIFGNSHSFFYDPDSLGNSFLQTMKSSGKDVGEISSFFYPDSTRFIGHNPDVKIVDALTGEIIKDSDFTIHEFPFYSYLVGDLHAHVISMMVVILVIALCIALLYQVQRPGIYEKTRSSVLNFPGNGRSVFRLSQISYKNLRYELSLVKLPGLFAAAILLGIAQMTNYWDFLIYFIFCAMAFLVLNTVRSKSFIYPSTFIAFGTDLLLILTVYMAFSERVLVHVGLQILVLIVGFLFVYLFPSALTRTSFMMNILFVISNIVAIPFNMNFDMISNKVALVKSRTSLFQFMIVWGTHLIICAIFIVFTIISKNYMSSRKKNKISVVLFDQPSEGYTNVFAKFFGERNLCDIFVCGIAITGLLMLIAPEIIYVRDIYTSGYLRANTMFKFTFAGFIMLSIVIAYAVIRLFWFASKKGGYSFTAFSFAIVCAVLLLVPAHFTLLSLEQRCGSLKKSNFKTLDGTAYIDHYTSSNLGEEPREAGNLKGIKECIDWFNNNVEGSHVICEAYGYSYTDNNIISSYTGLPTVFGWYTHEQLWRFHGIVDEEKDILVSDPEKDVNELYIDPRHNDINIIYTSSDANEVISVLAKYNVEYIVDGPFEQQLYGGYDNMDTFNQISKLVYDRDGVKVYKVR